MSVCSSDITQSKHSYSADSTLFKSVCVVISFVCVCVFVCLCVCLFVCVFVCFFVCLFVFLLVLFV